MKKKLRMISFIMLAAASIFLTVFYVLWTSDLPDSSVMWSNQPVPEYAAQSTNANYHDPVQFLYYLDNEYHIKNGSMLEFYIDVVDGYGFRYRSFVDCMAAKDNQPDEERMEQKAGYIFAEPVIIFDEKGNRIFELEPELFQ